MTPARVGALLALLAVLAAAPLVLGAYVVAQGASRRLRLAWFASLTALALLALGAGALALFALALEAG